MICQGGLEADHVRRPQRPVRARDLESHLRPAVMAGPRFDRSKTRCTMAMAYAMALPGSLENASAALGLTQQKDMAGHRLMMQMSTPRAIEPDGTVVCGTTSINRCNRRVL